MQDFDYTLTWYHGSQQKLTTLRLGVRLHRTEMWQKRSLTDPRCSLSLRAVRLSMTAQHPAISIPLPMRSVPMMCIHIPIP